MYNSFDPFEFFLERMLPIFAGIFMLFVAYYIFVWTPVNLLNEHKCITAGYPETRTSVLLQGVCVRLEGDVQSPAVPVDELE